VIAQGASEVHVSLAFVAAAGVLIAVVMIGWLGTRCIDWLSARRSKAVQDLVAQDIIASLLTDTTGEVVFSNAAATARFGDTSGQPLASALRAVLADPAPVLLRLRQKAALTGRATEDIVIRRGHLRITALQLDSGGLLWRCQDIAERSQLQRLALGADLPMLTIGRNDAILSIKGEDTGQAQRGPAADAGPCSPDQHVARAKILHCDRITAHTGPQGDVSAAGAGASGGGGSCGAATVRHGSARGVALFRCVAGAAAEA